MMSAVAVRSEHQQLCKNEIGHDFCTQLGELKILDYCRLKTHDFLSKTKNCVNRLCLLVKLSRLLI